MATAASSYLPDGTLSTTTTRPASKSLDLLSALVDDRKKDYDFLRSRGPVNPPSLLQAIATPQGQLGASSRTSSRPAPQASERPFTPRKPGFTPGGLGDPDYEPIWRYADGSYMSGAEAPPGMQGAAQTGFYRKRATGGGGSPGSVNPNAAEDPRWEGVNSMAARNATQNAAAARADAAYRERAAAEAKAGYSGGTAGTPYGSSGLYG